MCTVENSCEEGGLACFLDVLFDLSDVFTIFEHDVQREIQAGGSSKKVV